MPLQYDVVIVGAGPAGASAASKASERGVKTLLIEKRREVGIPVQCGEYMPSESEVKLLLPRAKHLANLINLTKRFAVNSCDLIRFISPFGSEFEFKFHAYVIDRSKFDKELVSRAEANGCDVQLKCRTLKADLNRNKLALRKNGKDYIVSFKVLIAADGAASTIARNLGLKTTSPMNQSPVIQNVMSNLNIESNVCEMYWGINYSPGGYAWIIPKSTDTANVGLGIRVKFSRKGTNIRKYLESLIHVHPTASKKLSKGTVLSTIGGVVPIGGPIPKTYYKNLLVVGDAAGQVLAHVGGGVPPAIVSGEIAGEVASSHLLEGTSLSKYEEVWRMEIGETLETSLKIRELGDLFIGDDRLTEIALKVIGSEGLSQLIRCKIPEKLGSLINHMITAKKSIGKIRELFSLKGHR